jgi:hypothetical protein
LTAGETKLKLQFLTLQNNCLFQIKVGSSAFTEFKFNRLSSFYARIANFTSGFIKRLFIVILKETHIALIHSLHLEREIRQL